MTQAVVSFGITSTHWVNGTVWTRLFTALYQLIAAFLYVHLLHSVLCVQSKYKHNEYYSSVFNT